MHPTGLEPVLSHIKSMGFYQLNYGCIVRMVGFEPTVFQCTGFTDQCHSTIVTAFPFHIDCWSPDGIRTRAQGLRIANVLPLLYPTELPVQPMCLLMMLIRSSTNQNYSCVSRFCACQHLPLLKFFYLTIAIVTRYPFTHFTLRHSFSLSHHFQFFYIKKPDSFESGFFGLV